MLSLQKYDFSMNSGNLVGGMTAEKTARTNLPTRRKDVAANKSQKKCQIQVTFSLHRRLLYRGPQKENYNPVKEIDFREDLLPLKNKLYRLALRITLDTAEAEDVTQDTLIRVWTKREELGGLNSLEAYCLTVCRNLALDRHDKKEAQNLSLDAAYEAADRSLSAQEQLEHDEKLRRVHELFNSLPERQRSAMQLRDIEGKSYKEVAETLGITEDNVKITLFRARQAIKKQYLKEESYGL